jgi:hypothetical protein
VHPCFSIAWRGRTDHDFCNASGLEKWHRVGDVLCGEGLTYANESRIWPEAGVACVDIITR